MHRDDLIRILEKYKANELSEQDVIERIKNLPYEDISFAKIDHHREMRLGFPEVIFCQNKTAEQVEKISQKIIEHGSNLLATRASFDKYEAVKKHFPEAEFNETAGTITYKTKKIKKITGKVIVITAGTSDIPIAVEALITGGMMGLDISMISDVGVAGIHRVLDYKKELDTAAIIIVIAGMEGALASVIGGLVEAPVIAVPTSIGYGTSFGGITPLLSMLNSCVPGVAVMNIDNGFGAAALAFKILNTIEKISKNAKAIY